MLGVCNTLLLLPMNAYAAGITHSYGIYVKSASCSGGSFENPCYEDKQEMFDAAVVNCTIDLQEEYKDRYDEPGAQVVTALSCKQVKINEEGGPRTSFVSGMACHVDTTFQEQFGSYDTTTDEGLRMMYYNGGSWSSWIKDFCLCPDGTTDVKNSQGEVVGCEEKPKTPPLDCE